MLEASEDKISHRNSEVGDSVNLAGEVPVSFCQSEAREHNAQHAGGAVMPACQISHGVESDPNTGKGNLSEPRNLIITPTRMTEATSDRSDNSTIHWAWPEEFNRSGLCDMVADSKNYIMNLAETIKDKPQSPLCIYSDSNLGPYTPINISIPYGATHDPINAYNIISLLGLPAIIRPSIPKNQPVIICSSFLSREMIENIDNYISQGGFAILDAKAAQCYMVYGEKISFNIQGPATLNKYEILPNGNKCELIADCPQDSIYYVDAVNSMYNCKAFDVADNYVGNTTIMLKSGQGRLAVFGYDLSRTAKSLLCKQWRGRLLDLFDLAGIQLPVFWNGQVAVQCFYNSNKVVLANYNLNDIEGELVKDGKSVNIKLEKLSLKVI